MNTILYKYLYMHGSRFFFFDRVGEGVKRIFEGGGGVRGTYPVILLYVNLRRHYVLYIVGFQVQL